MAQIAFIVNTQRPSAQAAVLSFVPRAEELARLLRNDLGDPSVSVQQIAVSDSTLVAATYDTLAAGATGNPQATKTGKYNNTCIVGGAAGNLTVTGIKTSQRLLFVGKIVDAGQAFTDLTSEFTISAANTINNTGGTTTASSHVVVVWA